MIILRIKIYCMIHISMGIMNRWSILHHKFYGEHLKGVLLTRWVLCGYHKGIISNFKPEIDLPFFFSKICLNDYASYEVQKCQHLTVILQKAYLTGTYLTITGYFLNTIQSYGGPPSWSFDAFRISQCCYIGPSIIIPSY